MDNKNYKIISQTFSSQFRIHFPKKNLKGKPHFLCRNISQVFTVLGIYKFENTTKVGNLFKVICNTDPIR